MSIHEPTPPPSLLTKWVARPSERASAIILPDGCRDLIIHRRPHKPPDCFLTEIDTRAREIETDAGEHFLGFRLKPGTFIDEARIIASCQRHIEHEDKISETIAEHTQSQTQLEAALDCLERAHSVGAAASMLGMQTRSLQRLTKQSTGYSPSFWLRLGRSRRAARRHIAGESLAEIAYSEGFCDQPHICREFQHWFRMSPRQLARSPEATSRIADSGYGS